MSGKRQTALGKIKAGKKNTLVQRYTLLSPTTTKETQDFQRGDRETEAGSKFATCMKMFIFLDPEFSF